MDSYFKIYFLGREFPAAPVRAGGVSAPCHAKNPGRRPSNPFIYIPIPPQPEDCGGIGADGGINCQKTLDFISLFQQPCATGVQLKKT